MKWFGPKLLRFSRRHTIHVYSEFILKIGVVEQQYESRKQVNNSSHAVPFDGKTMIEVIPRKKKREYALWVGNVKYD